MVPFSTVVLHHTGAMWLALWNVASLVAQRGRLFIPIYNDQVSEASWEGSVFRRSGFNTSRICFGEMAELFERADFGYRLPRAVRWEGLPPPNANPDESFRSLPADDLLVSGFDIVFKRKG